MCDTLDGTFVAGGHCNHHLPGTPGLGGLDRDMHGESRGKPVIAGVEAAGIPHSSALAFSAGLPSVFVRKEAKGHGLGQRIEGGDVRDRPAWLVEDMVTTGGSSLSAVSALRGAGAVTMEIPCCDQIAILKEPDRLEGYASDYFRD